MVVFANDALATAGVAVISTLFRLSTGIITTFSKSKQTNEDDAADETVGNDITTDTTYFSKLFGSSSIVCNFVTCLQPIPKVTGRMTMIHLCSD